MCILFQIFFLYMLLQNTCLFVTISKISLEMKIPIHLLQKTDIKYFHLFYFVCTKFVFRVCLLFYLFYWSIVDLQCFRHTAKWLGYIYMCMYIVPSHSVVSNSLWPYGLYPKSLLCPWDFSRQEYWSRLPFPPPGDLPDSGIELSFPVSLALTGGFFYHWAIWEAPWHTTGIQYLINIWFIILCQKISLLSNYLALRHWVK